MGALSGGSLSTAQLCSPAPVLLGREDGLQRGRNRSYIGHTQGIATCSLHS